MGSLKSQDSILQPVSWARNTLYESGCGCRCEFTCRPTKEISGYRGCGLGETEHDCASPKSAQAMATRARIGSVVGRGRAIRRSRADCRQVGERFREFGLYGLLDEPRVGPPRKITHTQIEDVITRHWTRWRPTHPLKHAADGRRSGPDAECPSYGGARPESADRAIVLCVDEKNQVQALNRSQPILPLAPGVPALQSQDYERHRVTSLFAAIDIRGRGSGSANFL
jgi:hypothetical protein